MSKKLGRNEPYWCGSGLKYTLGYQGTVIVRRHYLNTFKEHMMRHSFALFMQAIETKLTDIQELLLHSNPATTGLHVRLNSLS